MSKILLRVLIFWVLFELLLFGAGFASNMIPGFSTWGYGILGTAGAFLATWAVIRYEKRSFGEIGLSWDRGTLPRFFAGVLIGILIMGVMMLMLVSFTELRMQRNARAIDLSILQTFLFFIPLGLMEELGFRAYPLLRLNSRYGIWIAQITTALAFALYHMVYGWTIYISFTGPFVWAFVFGLAAFWSGGIALPTGLHVALNVMQEIFGLKEGQGSLWILDFEHGVSSAATAKADHVGLLLHVCILLMALSLTWWYQRKRVAQRI